MSPFGLLLRYFRNERRLPLKVLAAGIVVSDKVLSAIETGRRCPPDGAQLNEIKKILRLNEDEFRSLTEAARYSTTRVRIPVSAKPPEYRLVHRLVESIGDLSDQQIAIINDTLDKRGHTGCNGRKT